MLNYIKSEFYRNIHSKGNYIFLFGSMAFVVFLNVALGMYANGHTNFPYGNTHFSFTSFYASMGIIMIICLPLVSIIYGQEFKNHTLKNSISYGISRSQIYFTKFLMEVVISIINLILISAAYIITADMMLENSGIIYLNDLIRSIIACIPLFLVSVIVIHCLYFILENETTVVVYWAIIMIVIPKLLSMAGRKVEVLGKIASYMPFNIMGMDTYDESAERAIMSWSTQEGFIKCFVVGIIGVIVFYTLGLLLFKKREIK